MSVVQKLRPHTEHKLKEKRQLGGAGVAGLGRGGAGLQRGQMPGERGRHSSIGAGPGEEASLRCGVWKGAGLEGWRAGGDSVLEWTQRRGRDPNCTTGKGVLGPLWSRDSHFVSLAPVPVR